MTLADPMADLEKPLHAEPLNRRDNTVLAIALVLQLAILVWDALTPLGKTEWVLHLLPVALSLLQRRRWVPCLLAGLGVAYLGLGFILSDPSAMAVTSQAILNRVMGAVTMVGIAAVATVVTGEREQARQMLWVRQAEAALAHCLVGDESPEGIGQAVCAVLCERLGAALAVLYRRDGAHLVPCGGHAVDMATQTAWIALGEGLLGQVAIDGGFRIVSPAPPGHLPLRSALGSSAPAHLLLLPLRASGATVGVVELGLTGPAPDRARTRELADRIAGVVGMALRSALDARERQALLDETRRQAEELQVQQEELRVNNEELEAQGRVLRESQSTLEMQQTELEQANAQLAVHAQTLEQQKRHLLRAQGELQTQADALTAANRYKSEFLANMSHELRTPLNSSLILSRLLVDNKEGRLGAEQVHYAQAIHDSNNDLLLLINDILDLSKIEAGHADLRLETVHLADVAKRMRTTFEPLARQKQLALAVTLAADAPASLLTDGQRLQQVLKNLLANAVKFTARGEVALTMRAAADGGVRFDVRDTGPGIAADKQGIIFEAFRQADGSTSRQFGGTGLGLSISRELVQRMGGRLLLDSAPGQGSTFSVELPGVMPEAAEASAAAATPTNVHGSRGALAHSAAPPPVTTAVPSPPASLPGAEPAPTAAPSPGSRRVLMAVEDDSRFAEVLKNLVEELGFDCVVASTGEQALAMARDLQPSGILLDMGLPDQSGLTVLERLKRDPATRHVPVHVVSSQERSQAALELGAVGHVVKPARREDLVAAVRLLEEKLDQPLRRVLVVEDDEGLRGNLQRLLAGPQVEITTVGTAAAALLALTTTTFDCMVTDLALPDASGFELLERMAASDAHGFPPVIVYTGRALSRDEEIRLRRHSRSIIVKGARSPERLLDEVTLFLHSVEAHLPSEQQRLLSVARQRDAVLDGRCILLAEDDVRNIFALSSVFEAQGVRLEIARNGREAVDKVASVASIDLVLMDVMMPEMDGLMAMRLIRQKANGAELPIIALTAKAMADDRQQCLDAGANDYLAKPIDVERLLSLCRVWMPK